MHRLYQEKEREIRQAMTPLLNTLGQYESENKGENPVISEGEDLRQGPKERQRSPPAGNQREYEWPREEQGHDRKNWIGAINTSHDVSPQEIADSVHQKERKAHELVIIIHEIQHT